jgi:carbamoyltransferase
MNILGISCYYHDAAACLLKDGEVIAAAEEERFSRIKHDSSFPVHAIEFCLDFAGIQARELDFVVFNEKPFSKFERITKTIFATYPRSLGVFQDAVIHWMGDKLWIKSLIEEKIGIARDKILFSEHHISHAAGSFFLFSFFGSCDFKLRRGRGVGDDLVRGRLRGLDRRREK